MKAIRKGLIVMLTVVMMGTMGSGSILAEEQEKKTEDTKTDETTLKQIQSYEELVSMLEKSGHIYEPKDPDNERSYYGNTKNTQDLASPEAAAATGVDYSETNVQVSGVDEADTIKVDSRYIYTRKDNKVIAIVDTKDKMKQIGSIDCQVDGWTTYDISEFFLDKKYLTVILSGYENQGEQRKHCVRDDQYTGIAVYDISNKQKMNCVRKLKVEGSLQDIRKIDNQLYVITDHEIGYFVKNEYTKSDIVPEFADSTANNEMKEIEMSNLHYFDWSSPYSYTIMTSLDISEQKAPTFQVQLGNCEDLYMNDKAIYLTQGKYDYVGVSSGRYSRKTFITKYEVNKGKLSYLAGGCVEGSLLNQFSMDEYNGYFRLATNIDYTQGNNVYVLDNKLNIVGQLTGLAKEESIYSVRFDKDRGYVVTFQQVDPLFVIDLSTPSKPAVLGELKIPGFSQYLHPIGDNLVVGIGRSTEENVRRDEEGNEIVTGVRSAGIKLSLFDVTDPKAPKEINHIILGTNYGYSEALSNHNAVMVDKKRHILAIPVYLQYDEEIKITDGYSSDRFTGAYVFAVENGKLVGKAKLGQVDIATGQYLENRYYGYYGSYGSGRVCYIGDKMYYAYGEQINAYSLDGFKRIEAISLK